MRAGAAWAILNFRLSVAPPADPLPVMNMIEVVNGLFIAAGVIGLLASLRCIYVFTPTRWGRRRHWYWIGSVVSTFVF